MIKILLNTVIRNLYKQKAYSAINILGLATGVTCTLLILIWVNYEISFDTYHKDINRIYTVYENQQYADGDIFSVYSTPSPLAESLKNEYPEVEYASRMVSTWGQLVLSANGKTIVENGGKVVDPDFFKIFSLPILYGNYTNPLENENTIVLSRRLSERFFGDIDPVGLTIEINSTYQYIVGAVVENAPENSSIHFDFFLPFKFFRDYWQYDLSDWEANSFHTFLKLKDGANTDYLAENIRYHVRQRIPYSNVELDLQAFDRYHLYSINKNKAGPIWYVQVFLLVAVLILLIACFNYMNLATARSERRAREVAIRKVVGAQRRGLVGLFLTESIIFTCIALGMAIVFVELLLPVFGDLTNRTLTLNPGNFKFLLAVVFIVLTTGVLSGSYPALFLSSFLPIQVIRGVFRQDSAMLRKILVVIQFSMSIALFICTCVIYKQLNFLQESDIGYNKDNIVYVEMLDDFYDEYSELKNELLKIPGVHWVTAANQMPVNFSNSTWDVEWPGKTVDAEQVLFQLSFVDFDFIETFEMDVIQGRGFSKKHGEDTLKFIINESAAEKMGMVYTIGEEITLWNYTGEVIGIVKDFNFNSLQVGVNPLIMMRNPRSFKYIGIRVGEDQEPIVNNIRKIWTQKFPDVPFNYRLLEEDFDYFYQAESRMGKLFATFTAIAFIISCLGLFGLVSFVTESKAREVALRKVFGANVDHIFQLLYKDIFKWIMLSVAIAWVLSFFAMEWWLNGFAYRIEIGIGIFILAGILSILIAFLTIYKQIARLVSSAPAQVLKYE
ncbi:ABC transporter permease [Marinifilum caeruleilacunae]|uniref:ABC transporter permease n=1 Tax=Marinifilum caeruleilacunae TaxID=2499076 RepID=A0ABX1WZ34_9BACT|nr:ABC transporter permease [Marinifilum caeruleilacunae]NOU61329.1 ABC transporter permease [Marinifilum caeruleilacunae]